MTDRALLELAAIAAGIERLDFGDGAILMSDEDGHTSVWDPLTDDGDAFRLAVDLRLVVYTPYEDNDAIVEGRDIDCISERITDKQDARAATRRAIVRAAAHIGIGK